MADTLGSLWRQSESVWRAKREASREVCQDSVQRDAEGQLHVYYGVTGDGIHGPWREFLEGE